VLHRSAPHLAKACFLPMRNHELENYAGNMGCFTQANKGAKFKRE
jgi:hypothetical protein